MRFAGLDLSKRAVGFAITDEDGKFISFDCVIKPKREEIINIFSYYKPIHTFIGLPLFMNNSTNNINFIKSFSHNMRDIIGKFTFIDETLSTNLALRLNLPFSKDHNQIAARLILMAGLNKINMGFSY